MKPNQIVITLVLLIVFSTGSFFAGTKYQQKKNISQFSQRNMTNIPSRNSTGRGADTTTGTGQMKGNNGFNQTIGEVVSIDDTSITVKTADGGSKIILISDSTVFSQSTTVVKSDIKVGAKIAVMGSTNTDGSLTGKRIDLNPIEVVTQK
jgi:hypothetical protein